MGEDLEPTDGRLFFGWKNCKWFVREVRKIYSNEKSYFSKKRLESGAAFTVGQYGMIAWFIANLQTMTNSECLLWAGAEFAITGYYIGKIQEDKTMKTKAHENDNNGTGN